MKVTLLHPENKTQIRFAKHVYYNLHLKQIVKKTLGDKEKDKLYLEDNEYTSFIMKESPLFQKAVLLNYLFFKNSFSSFILGI